MSATPREQPLEVKVDDQVRPIGTRDRYKVFLLSKSARYFYDAEAVKEPAKPESVARCRKGFLGNDPERDAHNNYGDGFQRGTGYELTGRNLRSVWTISTQSYRGAHFATFPEKLVEPCVKAGTSERGCCPECGAPWERNIETTSERVGKSRGGNYGGVAKSDGTKVMLGGYEAGMRYATIDHGWQPGCECNASATVPCTVLDPFAGSGTTAEVALKLGRRAVMIELNPVYVDLMRNRLADAVPLFAGAEAVT